MRIPNLKVARLLLLPALAIGQTPVQTPDPLPVQHDTAVKPAEVKDLPSPLPGIVRSPNGGLQINGSGERRSAMLVKQADWKDVRVSPTYPLRFSVSRNNLTNPFNALAVHANLADSQFGTFLANDQRRFRADFDVIF